MSKDKTDYELPPEATAKIGAVDSYLGDTIQAGKPIEALMALKWLGEIASDRSKEAAQAATEGDWSWSDVGLALGISKQAAHEKLRARVHDKLAKSISKLDEAEVKGHAKIARRAKRGRRGAEWERSKHEKLEHDVREARDEIARAEKLAKIKIDRKM